MKSFSFKLFSAILIFSLGFAVYSNTFHCSFHFDDPFFVTDNPAIKDIHNLQSIWKSYPCRFITLFSFAVNYHFNQVDVFGYHVLSLTIHLISALLVWWLVLLTLSTPVMKGRISKHANVLALLVGLIFVSHPVQIESVTYIWQRAASLAAMFYLASLCFYIKARQGSYRGLAITFYICSLLTAVLAMFTKENTISLPLMILLYEFSFFKTEGGLRWKPLIPFFLTLLIIPITTFLTESNKVQDIRTIVDAPGGISQIHYFLTQMRVKITYIRLLFLPLNLNLDYDYPIFKSIVELPVLTSFLFLITIFYAAIHSFSKYRLLSFSIFWFLLSLFPESSFIPQNDIICEHRLYLPLVGYGLFLISIIYYGIARICRDSDEGFNRWLMVGVVALAAIIAWNSILTYQRNKVWKDELSLWDDTVKKSPHKARPHYNRGHAYDLRGDFTKAMSDYTEAIEINPYYVEAYNNRAIIYNKQGHFDQAMSDFNKAIRINPKNAIVFNGRGNIYSAQGDLLRAISDYTKAIEIKPDYEEAYYNRGYNNFKEGNIRQAISDFTKALSIDPKYAHAYSDRGNAFDKQDNFSQAMSDYNKALEIDPKNAEAYINRGSTYNKQGNYNQAISDFNESIELDPKNPLSYNNRGGIYANQGNFTEAINDFNKAIFLNPNYGGAYYNRGLLNDRQGHLIEAIADYNSAIEIDPKCEDAYYYRGNIYDRQGNFTQAILDYNKAIELSPKRAEVYNSLGIIYAKQSKFAQAIAEFGKVIVINPNNAESYNNLGLTYDEQGNSSQAIADYNQAISINPNYAESYYNRGIVYGKQNNFNQAISDYTQAIEINPNYAGAYYNRAVCYFQLKEYDQAWGDVQKVEELGGSLNPEFMSALKTVLGR